MNEEDRLALLRSTADGQSPMEAMRAFTSTVVARQLDKSKTYDLPAVPVTQIDQATLPAEQGFDMGNLPDRRALPGDGGAGSSAAPFQFQVFVRKIGGNYFRGVSFNSTLIQSYDYTDTLPASGPIPGTLTSLTPTNADTGWIATSTSDVVWLEVDVDQSAFPDVYSNPAIKSLGNGDSFGAGAFANDGGTPAAQSKMRKVIATMGDAGSGVPFVETQWTQSALQIQGGVPTDSFADGGGNEASIFASFPYPL